MNVENIIEFAEYLENLNDLENKRNLLLGFDMERDLPVDSHSCGTAACIGGHIRYLYPYSGTHYDLAIENHFELDSETASKIGEPNSDNDWAWGATSLEAAAMLRDLVKTGEVNWKKLHT